MPTKRRKIGVIASRLKAYLSFADNFLRTTSGSLGMSSSNGLWKAVRGTWSANGSGATTSDNSSTYPLVSVPMANVNSTITLDTPGTGTGAAIWVSASGSWWGVAVQQSVSAGTGNCSSYNPYNPCGSGGNCNGSGGNCNGGGGNCAGTGGTCIGSGGYCNGCGGTCLPGSGGTCKTYAAYNSYNCNRFGNQCGQCTAYNPYNPCPGYNPYYSCCSTNPYNPCSSTNPYNPCGTYNPYNPCLNTNPYNPCSSTNPCVGTGGTCSTYYDTYPRSLVLLRNVANAVSTIATQALDSVTSFPAVAKLKVAITGATVGSSSSATITASAYSDSSMTTQIGNSLVYSPTGVEIISTYGIVATPSAYGESKTVTAVNIS